MEPPRPSTLSLDPASAVHYSCGVCGADFGSLPDVDRHLRACPPYQTAARDGGAPGGGLEMAHRCGPCGGFLPALAAIQQHIPACAAFQAVPNAIIIDAPPGGPRSVQKVSVSPGVGALPYLSHATRKVRRRGRPPRMGDRYNNARCIYGDYLSLCNFLGLLVSCL